MSCWQQAWIALVLLRIEAGGPDVGLQLHGRHAHVVGGDAVLLEEQGAGHFIHPFVGALRSEDQRNQQLERRREVERQLGLGVRLLQASDDRSHPLPIGARRFARLSSARLPLHEGPTGDIY